MIRGGFFAVGAPEVERMEVPTVYVLGERRCTIRKSVPELAEHLTQDAAEAVKVPQSANRDERTPLGS